LYFDISYAMTSCENSVSNIAEQIGLVLEEHSASINSTYTGSCIKQLMHLSKTTRMFPNSVIIHMTCEKVNRTEFERS
jgi:hypothetical protein